MDFPFEYVQLIEMIHEFHYFALDLWLLGV